MWKDSFTAELPRSTTAAPSAPSPTAKPITEEEMQTIVERLQATQDIFRQNRELREVLSRRESETRTLHTRNTELEEIMRKFAPMLLNAAQKMGLAAKSEKTDARVQT